MRVLANYLNPSENFLLQSLSLLWNRVGQFLKSEVNLWQNLGCNSSNCILFAWPQVLGRRLQIQLCFSLSWIFWSNQIRGWSYKIRSVRSQLQEEGDGDCVAITRAQSVGGDVQQVLYKDWTRFWDCSGVKICPKYWLLTTSHVMVRKIPRSVVCHLLQLLDRRSLAVMAQVSRTFR